MSLSDKQRTWLTIELKRFLSTGPIVDDLQGELYNVGLTDDEVRSVLVPLQRLSDALHGLREPEFDPEYLTLVEDSRRQLNDVFRGLFTGFQL
jgi:hypothetical protein